MIALIRYWLAVLMHSQRYFAPMLLFVVGVVLLTSDSNGSLISQYATCSAIIFLSALWLTVAMIQVEDPVQRSIVVVNARSSARVLIAAVLVALATSLACLVFGLLYPIVTGHRPVTASALLVGALSQVCASFVGVAAGLVSSRLLIHRPAISLAMALVLATIALVSGWASPLNPLLRLMSGDMTPSAMVGAVGGFAALGLLVLVAATTLTQLVAVRRD